MASRTWKITESYCVEPKSYSSLVNPMNPLNRSQKNFEKKFTTQYAPIQSVRNGAKSNTRARVYVYVSK